MAHAALSVAKYFLALPDKDSGELISNLKLQKLLYYAQGYYVAIHGANDPLFNDKIYAWQHGPVVQSVYNHFAGYKKAALPSGEKPTLFNSHIVSHLDEIHRVFGRLSAWALREMTHREAPWLEHYDPDERDVEIPLKDLQVFFSKYVKKAL